MQVLIWEQEARVVEGGLLNWMRVCTAVVWPHCFMIRFCAASRVWHASSSASLVCWPHVAVESTIACAECLQRKFCPGQIIVVWVIRLAGLSPAASRLTAPLPLPPPSHRHAKTTPGGRRPSSGLHNSLPASSPRAPRRRGGKPLPTTCSVSSTNASSVRCNFFLVSRHFLG